ncbi:hypothetical protein [Microbacterium capsulatum]|uniref:Uncharacterized protein n=1 Tax=Microbacterium capsulatum TaxID=3041921 RepID=A0ABU0XIU8_9MICO|nr:hypothetical protein [Microbacterium sp. ASV81]MDQ4215064.1 hypothetical protein [Microbacterium sp. ASV81]
MGIAMRTVDEVATFSVRALGLDEEVFGLDYPEAIAASVRRAASFLSPTTPRALVDAVLEALTPVLSEPPSRDDLMALVDRLISGGDLLEMADATSDRKNRLLYLGPPSFVPKSAGRYLLTGIRPHGALLVPSTITVEPEAHVRTALLDGDTAEASLREAGLHRINVQQWVGQPAVVAAREFIEQYRQRLDVAPAAGFVDGLTIIDPAFRPTYYRGRWRAPTVGDSGDYVGRRPQAYGADRWCMVRLSDGAPEKLLDLPLDNVASPARDDAWRLQAAIDAARRTPLSYRVLPIPGHSPVAEFIVDFFSPLPSWVERYLELVGISVDKSRGALFSYRIPASALAGLQSALTETLWMTTTQGES